MPTARRVNPTTHGFLRWVASEIAPKTGIDSTTSTDEKLLATAAIVFDAPMSSMSHTAKNSVAMFIEKIVFEKSYSAQAQRSRAGARVAIMSPSAVTTGAA